MLDRFLKDIDEGKWFTKDDNLLVAVSGGVDSMVLLHLLIRGGFKISVAHCNFNLRGEQSDADENFVKSETKLYQVKCLTKTFSTKNYAITNGISTQMAARELRYRWFEELLKGEQLDYLLTAHHLNDSLETALFNFAKGTGLSGLRGILPKKNQLIRPLIHFTKDEILKYAKEMKLSWREDTSNASNRYRRNLIRNEVIPQLEKINPSLIETFQSTQNKLLDTENYLQKMLEVTLKEALQKKGKDYLFRRDVISNLVELDFLVKPFGFNYDQVGEIFSKLAGDSVGKLFLSRSHQLNIDREVVIISPLEHGFADVLINTNDKTFKSAEVNLKFSTVNKPGRFDARSDVEYFDLNKLEFPLKLRKWKRGDIFYPIGLKGKKKVSDYMIDNKIPLNLKDRVLLLESDGDVVWLVGYRIDDRYKVTSETQKCFKVEMLDD